MQKSLELTINRDILLKVLQMSVGVVEKRHTMQILANILLKIVEGQLIVVGSDLGTEIIGLAKLAEPVKKFHDTTVSAHKLIDICRSLPEESIMRLTESEDGKKITVASGKSRFVLATLPANDFPLIPEQNENAEFFITQDILKTLISKTYFAIPEQDVRSYLNGMFMEVQGKNIRVVASDGHRLAMNVSELVSADENLFAQIIIPRKAAIELMRLLDDSDEELLVELNTNYIRIKSDDFIFTSRLISGKFPNYNKSIPKDSDKQIIIDRSLLKQTVMRVAVLSNELLRSICFQFQSNLVKLFANNPEQEEADDELTIEYSGPEMEIIFNINYLLDILNSVTSEKIILNIKDSDSASVIEDFDLRENCLHVLMPIRR